MSLVRFDPASILRRSKSSKFYLPHLIKSCIKLREKQRFGLGNISKHLANNKPLHSQSQWMYADGSIVPIASYKGVRFSTQQINDYVAGKAIRVDGCQGEMPTLWIKFNSQHMTPGVYSSNPDIAGQAAYQSQSYGTRLSQVPSSGASQTQEGCANGGALPDDFKL